MNNYQQKILLLCVLLVGCVLTSIGVEYCSFGNETVELPQKLIQEPKTNSVINQSGQKNINRNVNKIKNKVKSPQKENFQSTTNEKKSQLVNINTASLKELDTLPGIGPAIAQRIVEYRDTQPFTKIEDIMQVKGIGKKKFAKLKELITVE